MRHALRGPVFAALLISAVATGARAADDDSQVRSRVFLAEQYASEGRTEDAADLFREVYDAHPEQMRAARGLKSCLLELKRWDELSAILQKELAEAPEDPSLLEQLGTVAAQKGDREGATRWWRGILDTQRGSRGAYTLVAELMTRNRLLDEALAVYAEGDSLYPGEFTREKAALHELRFEFDGATAEYLKFLANTPSSLSWVEGRLLRIGEAEESLDPVIARVQKALAGGHEPGGTRRVRANELVLRKLLADLALEGGRHEEACDQYFRLVDDEPSQTPALLVFGKRCQADGAYETAIRVFERIVRDVKDARVVPSALTEIARSQRELGRWDDALKTYARLEDEFPETDFALDARFQRGVILRDGRGRPDEAEAIFRSLIALPRGPWGEAGPQLQVAECALDLGDLDKARGIFAAIRSRDFSEVTRELALFEEANALFYAAKFDSADSLYKEVATQFPRGAHVNDALRMSILLNTNPGEPEVMAEYASAKLDLRAHRAPAAVKRLEVLGATHTEAALADDALLLLGEARRSAGDPRGALAALDQAVQAAQVPDLAADARLLKAEILAKDLSDRDRALAEYEDLIVQHPETLAADRARDERAKLTRAVP